MNTRIAAVLVAFLISQSLMMSVQALEISDLDNPRLAEAFVDGLVTPLMSNHRSPAGVVAIVKDGELLFAKGYGFQDVKKRIPVDPTRTLFRPGSISKLFTWVSVMQLFEQGKLNLDVDINQYLKTFQIKDSYPGQPIPLRHIMTHTPGFEDGSLGYLIIDDPSRIIPLAESMQRYQPERVNPPGLQTAYSNYAAAVAGLIVSNLSGMSFVDYVQKNIFDVLGMKNATFVEPLPEYLQENMVLSYAFEEGAYVEKPFEIISNFAPAGALSATSTDMLKFARAILNGGEYHGERILREETVRQMLTRNFSQDDRLMGMALGFYETQANGLRLVGHGGSTEYFKSELVIDQVHNLAFFVSFAGEGGSVARSAFTGAFYDTFYPDETKNDPIPPDFSEQAGKYAGSYNFWRSNFSSLEKVQGLLGGITVAVTRDNTLAISWGEGVKQYVEIEKNLFRELDSGVSLNSRFKVRLVAFQENDQGQITGFVMDGLPFMSLRKLPVFASPGFNWSLLGLSMLIFLVVLLRRFFQRSMFSSMQGADQSALQASFYTAAANWLVIITALVVLALVGDRLGMEIPLLLKLWLVLPIVAGISGLLLMYRCAGVWKNALLGGLWARLRYTLVTLAGLFMCWFYYYWNILGWQYFA